MKKTKKIYNFLLAIGTILLFLDIFFIKNEILSLFIVLLILIMSIYIRYLENSKNFNNTFGDKVDIILIIFFIVVLILKLIGK